MSFNKETKQMLYNSRGISVYPFEFSSAENLSAQRMGYLGATLMQVVTRERAQSGHVTQMSQ